MFFARAESSRLGATAIGAEHLLLGVMHEPSRPVSRILTSVPLDQIRSELESTSTFREKIPTSVEIPFTRECSRALNVAAQEADRLLHPYIGPEHLLLALIHEEKSIAGSTLAKYGVRLDEARGQIVQLAADTQHWPRATRADAFEAIYQIKNLVQQLGRTPPDTDEARDLVERIGQMLDTL